LGLLRNISPNARRSGLFALLLAGSVAILSKALSAGILAHHSQVHGLVIFCGVIIGILLFEEYRLIVGLVAAAATIAFGLFSSVQELISAANLDVIVFLLGTFLVAGYLEESLFFEHLASQIVHHVGRRPGVLMGVLMLSAMVASAIVGEVAAILFVGGAMMHIANRYKLHPIPFLMMLVFATNIGSAASPFGPVGLLIALKAKLGVTDFLRWATPIAIIALMLVLAISRWWFAKDWIALSGAMHEADFGSSVPDPSRRSAAKQWTLDAVMSVLFLLHTPIERAIGARENSVLLLAATVAGLIGLALSGRGSMQIVRHRIDWRTLGFFLSLFLVVGAQQATGVTEILAHALVRGSGGRPAPLVLTVGWSTGVLSGLLDNMLAVLTFLPIVGSLRTDGVMCPTAVYWLMLFGATFMGNMTSIGSTCNIIACGMISKRGHGTIYFRSWLKIGLIVSLASMLLATLLLAIQTDWLSKG
jgi:Na+/H+ antiporter NhaD/arsenite permease-like protein